MRLPPPEVRAAWPKPNYIDPETRGPALIIVELTILPLALLTLALRLYARVVLLKNGGWDDWLMVGAAIFGAGVTICVILASSLYGWDIHVWDLQPQDMISGRQVSIAAQSLFVWATSLAKVSILLSYLRFAPRQSWFRRLTLGTIGVILVANSVFFVVLWTQCRPMSSYWIVTRSTTDCNAELPPLLAQAIVTVVADFAVWVLPLPTLIKARLPFSQRLGLVVLFSCGLLVVFGAIMRTYWIYYVVELTYDVTWEGFHLWIWTAVEVHLGVICGCIPCLKALFGAYGKNNTTPGASQRQGGSSARRSKPAMLGPSPSPSPSEGRLVRPTSYRSSVPGMEEEEGVDGNMKGVVALEMKRGCGAITADKFRKDPRPG